ncbi:ArnT family glycosyltransferase [Sandaracinus amylolyticus]|uniref:ArnT family glycosyltransferase n=1 Tax=Sandaracinus amylolyticus TaxID=927083 RepID=UPI001F1F1840|nr:glycosyltransferase family 39 protein [Sandaracinus amylolyticus]
MRPSRSTILRSHKLPSPRATLVLGACFAWLVVLLIVDPMPGTVHGDGYYTWLWARSIVFDQDVDFERDYEICDDPWGLRHTQQGDVINQWNPGPSLFWIPILLFDVATDHPALHHRDPRYRLGCIGPLAERAVRGSLIAGVLTIVIAFVVARRAFGEGPALFGAVAMGVLTPLTYYATMLLSYGHAASAATGALVVLAWDRERRRPSRWGWVWLGVATGLAMLTRPQNAVIAILPLCLWIERAWGRIKERDGRGLGVLVGWGVVYALVTALVFAPQVWQWWDSQGELFFLPQGRHYLRWGAPRLDKVLFSTSNGLLVWSPILYVAVIGLVMLAWKRETRSMGLPLLLFFAISTYVNASVYDWWGALGFPGRRFDSVSVPFAIGIAAVASEVVERQRRGRSVALGALATAIVVVLGAWSTGTQVGVAQALRTDVAHSSERMWMDIWGRIARPVREHVGNPLAWPASIPFAIRHRISPRAWDVAGAPELFFHEWLTLARRAEEATFDFVERHQELLVGFDEDVRTIQGRRVRGVREGYARAIVPISWPEIGALRFEVARPPDSEGPVHVWLELDGEDLGSWRVDPTTRELRVPVMREHQGICELRIRVVGGWLGFGKMEMLDPEPAPSVEEAAHLRAIAERRRAWRAARHGDAPAEP